MILSVERSVGSAKQLYWPTILSGLSGTTSQYNHSNSHFLFVVITDSEYLHKGYLALQ